MTDKALFEEFLCGEPSGINAIWLFCRGPLMVYGLRFIKREEDIVADIVVESIELLAEHIGDFEDEAHIWKWLYTTVRNKCWTRLRTMHRFVPLEDEPQGNSDEEAAQHLEIQDAKERNRKIIQQVIECLERLPAQRRQDFYALYFESKSIERIALERGVSRGTVNENIQLALKAIRKYLKNKGLEI